MEGQKKKHFSKRRRMLYRGTAALEVWARRSVAGKVEVGNLAEDWRDGRAFLALLHHHRPELVDLSKMEDEDTVTNCSKAFAIAERLGVPSLLDPQDMAQSTVVDRLSILTYLSSLYHVLAEDGKERKISEDSGVSVEEEESVCSSSCSSSSGYDSPTKVEQEEEEAEEKKAEKVVRRGGADAKRG